VVTPGTQQATTTLTAATTTGATTSLSVVALTQAMASGDSIRLNDNAGHTQTATLSAAAAIGATTLTTSSFTPSQVYPVGSTVTDTTQVGAPVIFQPPTSGAANFYMLAWASLAGDEAIIWRKCQPDGSLDLNRQSGANKAAIPVNISILTVGGGVAPWKWMGALPQRDGPTPSSSVLGF